MINLNTNSNFPINETSPLNVGEIITSIFQYLDPIYMESTVRVCKLWNEFTIVEVTKGYDLSIRNFVKIWLNEIECSEKDKSKFNLIINETQILNCPNIFKICTSFSSMQEKLLQASLGIIKEETFLNWNKLKNNLKHLNYEKHRCNFKKFIKCVKFYYKAQNGDDVILHKISFKLIKAGLSKNAFNLAQRIESNSLRREVLHRVLSKAQGKELYQEVTNYLVCGLDLERVKTAQNYYDLASTIHCRDSERALEVLENYLNTHLDKSLSHLDYPRKIKIAEGYKLKGDILTKLKRYHDSTEAYQNTINSFLDAEKSYLLELKEYKPVLFIQKYLSIHIELGNNYIKLQEYEKALQVYQNALIIPENFMAIIQNESTPNTIMAIDVLYRDHLKVFNLFIKIESTLCYLNRHEDAALFYKKISNYFFGLTKSFVFYKDIFNFIQSRIAVVTNEAKKGHSFNTHAEYIQYLTDAFLLDKKSFGLAFKGEYIFDDYPMDELLKCKLFPDLPL